MLFPPVKLSDEAEIVPLPTAHIEHSSIKQRAWYRAITTSKLNITHSPSLLSL
jgi:hypothetical protein